MKKVIIIMSSIIVLIILATITILHIVVVNITNDPSREPCCKVEIIGQSKRLIGNTSTPNYEEENRTQVTFDENCLICDKPIIYLYPERETKVSVTLPKSENITCSYPKYDGGWDVLAYPNGDITDLDTNKSLYSLYYEAKNSIDFKVEADGFVVKSEDIASFLEEKLSILGLTSRETEEFIIYWLPQLEENPYTYIRFATLNEIEQNVPLIIEPTPDTTIRILMTFKGLDEPIEVEEQQLEPVPRNGFTAVEWGGTKL